MDLTRKLVIAGAACLLGIWLLSNWAWLEKSDDDIIIRLVLGSLLSILILLRPKPGGPYGPVPGWLLWGTSIGGVVMAQGGIIIPVHQLHWLGIIFVILEPETRNPKPPETNDMQIISICNILH